MSGMKFNCSIYLTFITNEKLKASGILDRSTSANIIKHSKKPDTRKVNLNDYFA